MKKFLQTALLSTTLVLTQNAIAGSSEIYYGSEYEQFFTTPSKNIVCGGDPLYDGDPAVSCYVYQVAKSAIPKSCLRSAPEGLHFHLEETGSARKDCGFEFTPEEFYDRQPKVIPYGTTIKGYGWQCQSTQKGLDCSNRSGHGFKLSRSAQTIY